MKPEQSVLNKLAKFTAKEVELSAEPMKLDLASINDIEKLNSIVSSMDKAVSSTYRKLYDEWSNLIGLSDRLRNVYLDMEGLIDEYYNLEKRVMSDTKDIAAQAKELGIDPSKIKGVKELVDNFANMEDNINQAIQRMPDIERAFEAL